MRKNVTLQSWARDFVVKNAVHTWILWQAHRPHCVRVRHRRAEFQQSDVVREVVQREVLRDYFGEVASERPLRLVAPVVLAKCHSEHKPKVSGIILFIVIKMLQLEASCIHRETAALSRSFIPLVGEPLCKSFANTSSPLETCWTLKAICFWCYKVCPLLLQQANSLACVGNLLRHISLFTRKFIAVIFNACR